MRNLISRGLVVRLTVRIVEATVTRDLHFLSGNGERPFPGDVGLTETGRVVGDVEIIDDASSAVGKGSKGPAGMAQSQGHQRQFAGSKRGDR